MDKQHQILEFLEILNPYQRDNLLLARDIYNAYGSIYEFFTATQNDVQERIPHLDQELLNRIRRLYKLILNMTRTQLKETPALDSLPLIKKYLSLTQFHEKKEYFRILFLDNSSMLLADEILEEGSEGYVPVKYRKIITRSVALGASKLILIHNHPKGTLEFSIEDKRTTFDLFLALQPFHIEVINHALITLEGVKLLKEDTSPFLFNTAS